jgi:nucleotide-binding universal stress UspA family protein
VRTEHHRRRRTPPDLLVQRVAPGRVRGALGRAPDPEIDVQLRVASFGVRSATMYPPEIGTDIESEVTEQWREQMAEAQAALASQLDPDTEYVVASGTSWWEALSSIDWTPNELLVLGSSSAGTLRRVFLGTNATKIIRHSPVPVLVVPHDEL